MTGLPVTSIGVLIRALKRSVLFQIASIQTHSVLLLFFEQNEGFTKSEVRKIVL